MSAKNYHYISHSPSIGIYFLMRIRIYYTCLLSHINNKKKIPIQIAKYVTGKLFYV